MRAGSALLLLVATACASNPATRPATAPGAPAVAPARPLPIPVDYVPFEQAVARGTRTRTGMPGPRYWTNTATYRLTARLLPETKRLEGSATITYRNQSPDTLTTLHLDLTQNYHRGDAVRDEPAEVTGGVDLRRVAVDSRELRAGDSGPRYQVFGTRLIILPPKPLPPGGSVEIALDWAFTIPHAGAGERMGWDASNLFFLAYWYPQMAVYDDVIGWHPDQFTGTTEFYADHANYDVTVDAPAGWLVLATGRLANPDETLSAVVQQRLRQAEGSDQVVHVVTVQEFGAAATRPGTNGRLRWHFVADSVRDVVFSATRESLWDAARTSVGDRDGDGTEDFTRVDALYRMSATLWKESVRYSQHAIRFHSRTLGVPYPWPHMTAVEAGEIIDGGMEFPMFTLIGDYTERGDSALYAVTAHEEGHMWFPMLISSDERRYSWMDEGTTEYDEDQAKSDFFPGRNWITPEMEGYFGIMRANEEGEVMRRSAFHYSPQAYSVATYDKPATLLSMLRGVLGDSVFQRGLQEYARRWKYRHPYPMDFFNTFESVSGRDLDWFWYSWYYTTWTLDQAVTGVVPSGTGTLVTITDRGRALMPVHLAITHADGQTERQVIPAEVWLSGANVTSILVPGARVTRVEIDPEHLFPDINRGNNVWTR